MDSEERKCEHLRVEMRTHDFMASIKYPINVCGLNDMECDCPKQPRPREK